MIKNFIQFNENLTFDKGYERMDKDSPDFERYWSHSKKMNNADYNSIVKFFKENHPDLVHLVDRRYSTVYINRFDSGVNTLIKRKIDGKIQRIWYLHIWETSYPEEHYFNISMEIRGDSSGFEFRFSDRILYYTADGIYGLLNFFKDLFDPTKEM